MAGAGGQVASAGKAGCCTTSRQPLCALYRWLSPSWPRPLQMQPAQSKPAGNETHADMARFPKPAEGAGKGAGKDQAAKVGIACAI